MTQPSFLPSRLLFRSIAFYAHRHVVAAMFAAMLIGEALATVQGADLNHPAIDSIHVGFSGHDGVCCYKVGYWTPIEVTVSAGSQSASGELEIVVPDGDGVPSRVVERGVALAAGEKKTIATYVKFGRPHAAVGVTLRNAADGAVVAERTFSGDEVPAALGAKARGGAQKLILELGSPVEFGSAIRIGEEGEPEETAVVAIEDASQWPARAVGYDGVDLVVLTTGDLKKFEHVSTDRLDALDGWLRLGGKLLLSLGANGGELIARGKPLARFAPGVFQTTKKSQQLFSPFESFAGTLEPLNSAEGTQEGDRATLTVSLLDRVRGLVEVAQDPLRPEETPLVVRTPVGFGETIFVAADLDLPPISRWKARPELLAALLGRRSTGAATGPTESRGQGMQYGYDDLVGQLRASLDQYPGVKFVPFWLVAALTAAYILILFPLDYFLGGRRRPGVAIAQAAEADKWAPSARAATAQRNSTGAESASHSQSSSAWPWMRFAALVTIVSAGAMLLGWHWKGKRIERTEAVVVDCDLESGLARGTNWLGLYSPANETHDVELRPVWRPQSSGPVDARLSWLGLPGSGIGGMTAPPAELPQFTSPYELSAVSPKVSGVPLATWSSKCFTGRWSTKADSLIDADLRENSDRQLIGVIQLARNAQNFKLTHCILFHDRWAYTADSLSAADPIDVERLEARTSETLLTNRRALGEREQIAPYDRGGLDTERILQMMMFYKLAGGNKYIGLRDRYQHELDFSEQLALGRAVLVGIGPPAAEVLIDGQAPGDEGPHALTIYRFVIPVKTAGVGGQGAGVSKTNSASSLR